MKVVTPCQMNDIDKFAINNIGIPGIVLMENAALRVVDEIVKDTDTISGKKVLLFTGKGNNGGDAFAVARHLCCKGALVEVYIVEDKESITGDAKINLDILHNMEILPRVLTDKEQLNDLESEILKAHIVVDGIFGTGFKGIVQGIIADIIGIINKSGTRVVSIDIPSGIDGETGKVNGECIRAHKTVTFALPKLGTVIHPGCEYTGELKVVDIGIPAAAVRSQEIKISIIERDYVLDNMPQRLSDSNKGSYGKIIVITGSSGMTGAGALTAKAALRTGAGLVYLGVPASLTPIYETAVIDAITVPFEDNGTGYFSKSCTPQIINKLQGMSLLAAGPGLSVNDYIIEIIGNIIEKAQMPLVLDADALNAISNNVAVLRKLKTEAVITPHPGEMARLTGISIQDVQNNRINVTREFAEKWGVVTVLKGSRTVVACPTGRVFINTTGNPGMAVGGTGDVLTGIISGLIAQGVKPVDAAAMGVYIHGLAGDEAAEDKGIYGLIAGDIVEQLPYTIKGIIGK